MIPMTRVRRLFLLLGCTTTLLALPRSSAEEPASREELAAGITRLRDAIGAYRAEYDVAILAIDASGRQGHKKFALTSNFWTLTDGMRFKTRYEYQAFCYLTDSSPLEIRTFHADATFDGLYYSESNSHYSGRVSQSEPDEPLPNPISIWLELYDRTLEELLLGENVRDLGEQLFGDTLCRVFEFAHPFLDDRVCQVWLQKDGTFTIPHRIAAQFISERGNPEDSIAIELIELARTSSGVPYPKTLSRRLYMGWAGRRICFDDQTFQCKEFAAQVAVSDGDFEVRRPSADD